MNHTLETYPARQYSTKNRRRHTKAKRLAVALTLVISAALVWAILNP